MTLNNGTIIWKLDSENGRGQVEKETLGNGIVQTYGYTSTGAPSWRKAAKQAAIVQHFAYTLNEPKGLLAARKDMLNQREESFTYDDVNRLWKYTDNSFKEIGYDNKGSITSKPDAGQLTYNVAGKPYAVGELSANLGSVPPRNQYVSYSSFERPLTIDENDYHASFSYNAAGQRMHMVLSRNNLIELSRYYLGDCYELEVAANGTQTERLFLGGSAYNAPAVWVKQGTQEKLLYVHRDYLGSITHLTNEAGVKAAEYSYDAWGRMRNPQTLEPYGPDAQPELLLARGYTGHEHLPWFGLVNMNARLYDPVLGRFLSPDPYVSSPDFSQSFNRYIYGLNNPLAHIDPDGEHPLLILGALFAATYLGGVASNNGEWNPFKWDWKNTTLEFGVKTDGSTVTPYGGMGTGKNPYLTRIGIDSKGNLGVHIGESGNTTAINLTTPKQENINLTPTEIKFDPMNMAMNTLGAAGTISSTVAGLRYTSSNFLRAGYWTGVNGKMYSMKLTTPGSHGWNFYKNSANIAKTASNVARIFGNSLGYITTFESGFKFVKNPNWEDGIDTGVSLFSLFVCWEVGVFYFPYKGMSQSVYNHHMMLYEHGITPGLSDMFWGGKE